MSVARTSHRRKNEQFKFKAQEIATIVQDYSSIVMVDRRKGVANDRSDKQIGRLRFRTNHDVHNYQSDGKERVMTINDLHMTEEQIVDEIQFMRMWDKYLQKMLGKEKHSELSLGFARMLTSAELKSFGASDEEIEKACNFADMMAIADEHKADTPQTEVYDYKGDGKWERSE